jgi:hypothetical protein
MSDEEMDNVEENSQDDMSEDNEEEDDVLSDDDEDLKVLCLLFILLKKCLQSDNDQDDLFPDDEPPKAILKRSRSFEVIPNEEILKESKAMIDDIVQVCGIPTSAAAAILLRHFK